MAACSGSSSENSPGYIDSMKAAHETEALEYKKSLDENSDTQTSLPIGEEMEVIKKTDSAITNNGKNPSTQK